MTPADGLLTTILAFHHQTRASPATIVLSLRKELGLSDLTLMDTLEENLQLLTPAHQEPLGNYLWRAQGALAEYNLAAPRHGFPPYSERRLFNKIASALPPALRDLLLPELRLQGGRPRLS